MICAAGQKRMGWPFYENLAITGQLAEGSPRSPLDATANGQVPGEGVVVVLLKRLADAQGRWRSHSCRAARRGRRARHVVRRGVARGHAAIVCRSGPAAGRRGRARAGRAGNETKHGRRSSRRGQRLWSRCTATSADDQFGGRTGGQHGRRFVVCLAAQGDSRIEPRRVAAGRRPRTSFRRRGRAIASVAGPGRSRRGQPDHADGRRLAGVGTCSRGLAYHVVLESGSRVPVNPTGRRSGAGSARQLPPLRQLLPLRSP